MGGAEETFDYIVTGAGSAGCAVAARLSESGRYRVLLLEAGGRDTNPWIHIPMGFYKVFANPRVNWMYESEPEAKLDGRTLYQPRGKVLGGTSSINGMVYMRGNAADYDEWRQRGCEGWDYDFGAALFQEGRRPGTRTGRISRRGRAVARLRPAAAHRAGRPAGGGRDPGRPACQRRFQRRPAGGCGLFPKHHRQQPPLEHRHRLSAPCAGAGKPGRPAERTRNAHFDRGGKRRRRDLCQQRYGAHRPGARRSHRQRRRVQLAAASATGGDRAGSAIAGNGHSGGARPAGSGSPLAGPFLRSPGVAVHPAGDDERAGQQPAAPDSGDGAIRLVQIRSAGGQRRHRGSIRAQRSSAGTARSAVTILRRGATPRATAAAPSRTHSPASA